MKLNGIWIGDFDRKITIEEPTYTVDSVSSQRKITGWTTVCTAWAARVQESKEMFEVQQQLANNSGEWMIRYNSLITEVMRVNDHGVYHDIKGIRIVDRNNFLVLTTERRPETEVVTTREHTSEFTLEFT